MKKEFVLMILCMIMITGCSGSQLTGTWYAVEGVGLYSYDRYQKCDDVVLVKGINGEPNRVFMRRGWNKLWGASSQLKKYSGVRYWRYLEKNRKIQFYDDIAVARYGKYKFEASTNATKSWIKYEKWMSKKYPKKEDYMRYEHLLRKRAKINEATSEWKQEVYMFKK